MQLFFVCVYSSLYVSGMACKQAYNTAEPL